MELWQMDVVGGFLIADGTRAKAPRCWNGPPQQPVPIKSYRADDPKQIRPVLDIPEEEIITCGMAIGYEDVSKPENSFRTERAPLEEFVTFVR